MPPLMSEHLSFWNVLMDSWRNISSILPVIEKMWDLCLPYPRKMKDGDFKPTFKLTGQMLTLPSVYCPCPTPHPLAFYHWNSKSVTITHLPEQPLTSNLLSLWFKKRLQSSVSPYPLFKVPSLDQWKRAYSRLFSNKIWNTDYFQRTFGLFFQWQNNSKHNCQEKKITPN